jgi:hypothetical protein
MMLTNDQMIPDRFLRMAKAKKRRNAIEVCFADGGVVQVVTYFRATTYKSIEWFRFDRFSAYVRRGKQWDCIDYAKLRFGYPRQAAS